MYKPENMPYTPTEKPSSAWDRIDARFKAQEARIAALEQAMLKVFSLLQKEYPHLDNFKPGELNEEWPTP